MFLILVVSGTKSSGTCNWLFVPFDFLKNIYLFFIHLSDHFSCLLLFAIHVLFFSHFRDLIIGLSLFLIAWWIYISLQRVSKNGSLACVLFAEFSKPWAILCSCFSRILNDYFWLSPSIQCKIFLPLVLSFQLINALRFEISKNVSLLFVSFMISSRFAFCLW